MKGFVQDIERLAIQNCKRCFQATSLSDCLAE